MRAATPEEIASLAQAAEPRWQALILLAAYSGLRWGALAGLRRTDVDGLHRTVRVEHQLTEVNGHLSFSAPKTTAGVRTITLPQFIVDVMVDHLARWSAPGPDGLGPAPVGMSLGSRAAALAGRWARRSTRCPVAC